MLELISLQSEMLELKANPKLPAMGVVIETKLNKGKGILATVLIQDGHLKIGDYFVIGKAYGKVRSMICLLYTSINQEKKIGESIKG